MENETDVIYIHPQKRIVSNPLQLSVGVLESKPIKRKKTPVKPR